ncbi:MAG: TspO/MBR family protein [Chitinophagaceae bacterium]
MKFIISLLIPLAIGSISAIFTVKAIPGWYAQLNKPWFNPPNWIFSPVWTTLYIFMGIALWLVWKADAANKLKQTALAVFGLQLVLNFFWSFIFFNNHQLGWAFAEIVALWLLILLTIISFAKINTTAAWLLVPYISWVSFAGILNYTIWQLNKG